MDKIRLRQTRRRVWVDWLVLGLIIALSIFLRAYWQYHYVFVNGQVIFREADPFLHMRLAENIAANFPHAMRWDYYALYPSGAATYSPILAYLIATIAYVIGLGHPSMYLVDSVGAWIPPVLAALVCVVVYALGREVFKSRIAGLVAALVISILPSEYFHRSMLGFADHHILEVLLATTTLLLFITALNRHKVGYFLAGLAVLAIYCINWIGWPLFVAVLVGWGYYYFMVKYVHGPVKNYGLLLPVIAIMLGVILSGTVRYYFLVFLSNTFLGFTGTIQEVKPTNLQEYYILYGVSGFIALGGVYLAIKNKLNSLLIVWSIFIVAAAIAEKRWGYYAVISTSLFAGYAIAWLAGIVKKDWKVYVLAYCCLAIMITTTMYSLGIAKRPNDISDDWYRACVWLKNNTPEPYSSPDAYYQLNPGPAGYGILSWWDYGHWIIQVSHRVPIASPTQQERPEVYPFFVASTEDEANKYLEGKNIKYIVIDEYMAGAKYYAIYKKVKGTDRGWQQSMSSSMVCKMYYGEVKTWRPVYISNTVKIFARIE